MKVVVQSLTGTLFHIQVDNDATVADLMREIEAQQKLPYDRMILIPDDDRHPLMNIDQERATLVDCGLQDGSHIYLFFNPLDDGSTSHLFSCPEVLLG